MHKRRDFMMNIGFKFKCTLSFTLILRQFQSNNTSQLIKNVESYKKWSTSGPVPKHWLEFSYIL